MRAVFLAAGQGSRLGANHGIPKPLTVIAGKPLLVRSIAQVVESGLTDISVVLGYQAEAIEKRLRSEFQNIHYIYNSEYASDTNIRSAWLGLQSSTPTLLFEADIAWEAAAMQRWIHGCRSTNSSLWATQGLFQPHQLGGIAQVDVRQQLTDLRYVTAYSAEFSNYYKLLGALYVGPGELLPYRDQLSASIQVNTRQYYMTPWCEHLSSLPAKILDLSGLRVGTFNTPDEYLRVHSQFEVVDDHTG